VKQDRIRQWKQKIAKRLSIRFKKLGLRLSSSRSYLCDSFNITRFTACKHFIWSDLHSRRFKVIFNIVQ
ncbi:hypothetical protein L9F63_024709, partial [Diploptera punctata]